jgi:hypothetical protein
MLNITRLALLFCALLLGACTVTGPADDGYDNSNEWTDNGTLMSDDTKTLYDSEAKKSSATVESGTVSTTATTATNDKDEFEQFKEWNELRGQGAESAEYQEFLQWREYQKFKATQ